MNIKIDILMNIKCKDRIKKKLAWIDLYFVSSEKSVFKSDTICSQQRMGKFKTGFFSQTGLFVWFQIASFCIPFVLRFST